MQFKLAVRFLVFAGLVSLATGELVSKLALASNTGRIVFTSLRDGNAEIYVMDADGGNQENLTNHLAYDVDPDWSPDGTKIAFESWRDGNGDIYVMDADGKNVIRLTDGPGTKSNPDWSPDGKKIAFSVDDLADRIDVIDADGRNREKLADRAMYPSWSPDGKQIAFVNVEIYVIGDGGQGRKKVTDDSVGKWSPSFAPDGRRIAYDAGQDGEVSHIYVVGADGRNRVRLTHNEEEHWAPAWSPDGRIIAYHVRSGNWDGDFHATIHLMASDGRYIRQLSHGGNARDLGPDISPLGLAVSPASNKSTIWGRLKARTSDLP